MNLEDKMSQTWRNPTVTCGLRNILGLTKQQQIQTLGLYLTCF